MSIGMLILILFVFMLNRVLKKPLRQYWYQEISPEVGRTHDLNKLFYQIEKLALALPVKSRRIIQTQSITAATVRYNDQESGYNHYQ